MPRLTSFYIHLITDLNLPLTPFQSSILMYNSKLIPESQFITLHQAQVAVILGHGKVRRYLLVEADVPPDLDIVLGLALLQPLVVVSLQFDEGTEYILVLVSILNIKSKQIRNTFTWLDTFVYLKKKQEIIAPEKNIFTQSWELQNG